MARSRKGFVIILALAMTAAILITAVAIVNLGCGEALQSRRHNDTEAAYYVAVAGAERMYANLRDKSNGLATVTWPLSISTTSLQVGSDVVGSYAATANLTGQAGEFMIISDGTANGRTARVTVKYGYTSTYTNGLPVGSIGPMDFLGQRWWFLTSYVYAEGPVQSASTINPNSNTNNRYVQYSGGVTENASGLQSPSFWLAGRQASFDVNGDSQGWTDGNGSNSITAGEVPPGAEAAFAADDVTGDGVVDSKDAFKYYYTVYLNAAANNGTGQDLGINEGGPNHYNGDQTFGPFTVPAGTKVIFVDGGDANIVFNGQQWWNNDSELTVVSTDDIVIVQPVNGPDDRLTLIAQGNTYTGGLNLGQLADVDGNLISYSGGNFIAILGGSTNGAIFANGLIDVDTGLPSFLFNRDFNKATDDWSNPANKPVGLPPNFGVVSLPFSIKAENLGVGGYNPRWQRR